MQVLCSVTQEKYFVLFAIYILYFPGCRNISELVHCISIDCVACNNEMKNKSFAGNFLMHLMNAHRKKKD